MIVAFPHRPGKGGPGSFQSRIEQGFRGINWRIVYPNDGIEPDVIIVVAGTKKLWWLLRMKMKGIPIIYRLDGISWLHRKTRVSPSVFLMCELRNLLLQVIRSLLASRLVYQSRFVFDWWTRNGWATDAKASIIYNGVDLSFFKPMALCGPIDVLCIEGSLDYSPYAIRLINNINARLEDCGHRLVVYGGFENEEGKRLLSGDVDYRGYIAPENVPSAYRNAIFLSLDVNPACPNTVIEALASGIPVVGFNTGAMAELVSGEAGVLVDYGSDPWELAYPDEDALFGAIRHVLRNWEKYSISARKLAEERFNISDVQEKYVEVILESKGRNSCNPHRHQMKGLR